MRAKGCGVRRARGASDERARQTQLVTASSDICLSLCFSSHHGRRCGVACGVRHVACGEVQGQCGAAWQWRRGSRT